MAIADIFEALTAADRPYKKPKTLSGALRIMGFMRDDRHIDADLFDLFLRSGVYRTYAEAISGTRGRSTGWISAVTFQLDGALSTLKSPLQKIGREKAAMKIGERVIAGTVDVGQYNSMDAMVPGCGWINRGGTGE